MSKKQLLYFLIEKTTLSDTMTPIEEIREAYLKEYDDFKTLNMNIGLFLSIIYENDLIKTHEKGYNIGLLV